MFCAAKKVLLFWFEDSVHQHSAALGVQALSSSCRVLFQLYLCHALVHLVFVDERLVLHIVSRPLFYIEQVDNDHLALVVLLMDPW